MSKILTIDNMLDAAREDKVPGYESFKQQFEALAQELGEALAKHYGIRVTSDAEFQGTEFGGLCVHFGPAFDGQPCPDMIDFGDEGGDWGEWDPPEEDDDEGGTDPAGDPKGAGDGLHLVPEVQGDDRPAQHEEVVSGLGAPGPVRRAVLVPAPA